MKNAEKSVTLAESRLSKQIATNDDAAAKEQEVEEQIEEDNVKKAARENGAIAPGPINLDSGEMETADDAAAAREEAQEQAEESHIDNVAIEDGHEDNFDERVRSERAHP